MGQDNLFHGKKAIIVFSFALLFAFSFFLVSSLPNAGSIKVIAGNNNLSFNSTNQFNVSMLIKLNPEIEVVSYNTSNGTIGYVNFAGGLGQDFEIGNGISYEIYSSKNSTLILPT